MGNTAACIGGLLAVPISGYIYDTTHSWGNVFLLYDRDKNVILLSPKSSGSHRYIHRQRESCK